MKKTIVSILTLSLITISLNYGQVTSVEKGFQAITMDAIKAQLGFLASDWTEGREAGEKGEYIASDYIASMLQLYRVRPGGDYLMKRERGNNLIEYDRTYFQNFILLKTMAGNEQIFKIKTTDGNMTKTTNFTYNVDFVIRPSDPGTEFEAPVIFAGYGYKNDKLNYNDLNKLDVRGKFILKITGIPKFISDTINKSDIASYSREMESIYREMGAIGIIEYNPEATTVGRPDKKDFMRMSPSEGVAVTGRPQARFSLPGKKIPDNLVRIVVSVKTANEILKGTGIIPDDYIRKADLNERYMIPQISERTVYLKTSVTTTQIAVRNVIGLIEGNNPDKIIVLGAHYDHMGIGNGYIWNGADDNGSGTVGVMTLAKAIMATGEKPEHTIIIALWTAEEEGLLGSGYYMDNINYPTKNIKLNLNLDMISRYISDDERKKVTMTYTSSCSRFKEMTITNLKKYGIDLSVDYQPSDNPQGGTDHRSFVEAGVPIMRFKPGHREEYHTPMDELATIDWDIMEKIIRISFANTWELANTEW